MGIEQNLVSDEKKKLKKRKGTSFCSRRPRRSGSEKTGWTGPSPIFEDDSDQDSPDGTAMGLPGAPPPGFAPLRRPGLLPPRWRDRLDSVGGAGSYASSLASASSPAPSSTPPDSPAFAFPPPASAAAFDFPPAAAAADRLDGPAELRLWLLRADWQRDFQEVQEEVQVRFSTKADEITS